MMTAHSFSKKETIQFGWKTTLKNLPFLVGITLVMGLMQFAPSILEPYLRDQELLASLINVAAYILSLGVTLGSVKIYLKLVDGKTPPFSDLFSLFKTQLIWRYFAASIIYGLAVVLGLFLLIVPGLYIAIKYLFYTYYIVDKDAGVFESFSKSGEITKDRMWNIFLLEVLLGLILLAGFIVFGIGIFVAMPVVSLATAYLYRKLSPHTHSHASKS